MSRRAECALATFRGSSRPEPGLATGEICSAANLTINTACQAGLTNIHGVVQSCPGQPLNIIGGPQEETAVSDCPGDWLRLGRGCYLPVQLEGGVSQQEAQAECEARGGGLVSINTRQENIALSQHFLASGLSVGAERPSRLFDHNTKFGFVILNNGQAGIPGLLPLVRAGDGPADRLVDLGAVQR